VKKEKNSLQTVKRMLKLKEEELNEREIVIRKRRINNLFPKTTQEFFNLSIFNEQMRKILGSLGSSKGKNFS